MLVRGEEHGWPSDWTKVEHVWWLSDRQVWDSNSEAGAWKCSRSITAVAGPPRWRGLLCLSVEEVTRVCGVITWPQLLSDLCPSGALGFGPSHENLDFCSAICEWEGLQLTASKVSSSSELVSRKCLCPYVDFCVKDTEMQETHGLCSLWTGKFLPTLPVFSWSEMRRP